MPFAKLIFFGFLAIVSQGLLALENDEFLLPADAFKVSAKALSADNLEVSWIIAPGYSVYRSRMRFQSKTATVELGEADFPEGKIKHDELLGDIVHYHDLLKVRVPLIGAKNVSSMQLFVQYQACADKGICYPPQKATLDIPLPTATTSSATANPLAKLVSASGFSFSKKADALLPPEQAFQFFAELKDANTLHVNWKIAENYYLYREKFQLSLTDDNAVSLGSYSIPHGEPKHDEAFGQVETFHDQVGFDVPLLRNSTEAQTIHIEAKFQGCADRGVCYPPMQQSVELALPVATATTTASAAAAPISEQDQIIKSLHQQSLLATLLSFFGFGLLLSFTPCVFPMIPILSGIIVGHGKHISTSRAFLLSFSYVLASAVTYTGFCVLAALFGSNLQATFQQPWIIALFSAIFVALSFSMFGFYHLELPKSLQAKLHNSSERHRDGSLWGAAIMGALSSLIVGPCVAAPLAGALIFIGQTGNALIGGAALFAMGLGMGMPLLLIGTSAGKLLPKAGDWLNATKAVFGVIMLAVAVWMLSRILPANISMLLYAMLLILPSIYLRAMDNLPEHSTGWQKLWKGIGVTMLVYGLLLVIGVSMGNSNPLQPLQGLGNMHSEKTPVAEELKFVAVTSVADLEAKINQAAAANRPVMLDFYADWCISCKEMEAYTFTNPEVKNALANFVLLRADVTENNAEHKALLAKFQLIGPPGVLFFGADGKEKAGQRVIGYQDANTFLQSLKQLPL